MIIFYFYFFLSKIKYVTSADLSVYFYNDVTTLISQLFILFSSIDILFCFRSRKITSRSMDLLSVSFRSMADLEPEQEEFLELEGRSIVEKVEPSEKSRLISGDEDSSVDDGEKNSLKDLRTINLNEVAWHDTVDSCWIVIRDFVYDCTDFLKSHPGGSDVILEYAGRDATLAFIGTGHSSAAIHSLKRYLIGELPVEERIFRVPNGLKISAS